MKNIDTKILTTWKVRLQSDYTYNIYLYYILLCNFVAILSNVQVIRFMVYASFFQMKYLYKEKYIYSKELKSGITQKGYRYISTVNTFLFLYCISYLCLILFVSTSCTNSIFSHAITMKEIIIASPPVHLRSNVELCLFHRFYDFNLKSKEKYIVSFIMLGY